MAPVTSEQAEGKPVDKRADIWSFGVVLYEMLSGQRCFDGKTVSHILVHVIEQEPEWDKLPDAVPSGMRDLLKRCLEKDASRRLRDIGDVRLLLQAMAGEALARSGRTAAVAAATHHLHARWLWLGIALFFLSTVALGALYFWPKPAPSADVMRFEIPQPANVAFSNNFAISPDGRKLAFIAGIRPLIWIRSLDGLEPRPLEGTFGAAGVPFWSPDSRYIVFFSPNKLQKIEASGGPVQTLCDAVVGTLGGFWTPDNRIVFASNGNPPLRQVPASGGTPTPVTAMAEGEGRHAYPSLLPDGRHFVYLRARSNASGGIYLGSLDANPKEQSMKALLPDVSPVAFIPGGRDFGYILFRRATTLMAVPFDTQRLEIAGEAVPIAEPLGTVNTSNGFSISASGVLIYRTGGSAEQQFALFDRQGKSLGTVGEPWLFPTASAPALSPDGKRLAVSRIDPQSGDTDIWLYEFARSVSTRFTFDPGVDQNPVWSPDGSKIVFSATRGGTWGIYQKVSNLVGGEELLYKSGETITYPTSWSRDGRFVLFQTGGAGVSALPMEGDHKPITLLPSEYNQRGARFSPDGRFYSYLSSESGKDEVYVRSFDPSAPSSSSGGKWMVSKDGGSGAHWRADGKEILYMAPDQTVMAVEVSTGPVFQSGVPKPLFKSPSASIFWESSADGQRFLIPAVVGANAATPYTVILNWTSLLPKPRS